MKLSILEKIKLIKLKYHTAKDLDKYFKILSEIAKLRKGKIKEGEIYINSQTKITFIDQLGNEFKMKPNHITSGHWSPYESGSVYYDPEYHMRKLEEIVLSKGGKIKEGELYVNSTTKMTFIDQLGNEFKMKPRDVKSGKWSYYEKNCSEHICRQIIEKIYNKDFPSNHNLLKQSNGNRLQLDGYCKKLNIGFEYQGQQHFFGWGATPEKKLKSLIAIQKRDLEKEEQCKNNNILLLKINYYKDTKSLESLINQTIKDIKKSYKKFNIKIPSLLLNLKVNTIKIDLSKISNLVKMREELENTVFQKQGKIKEGEVYINNYTKMIFIDKLGNEFSMSPQKVKSGQWSPYEKKNHPLFDKRNLLQIV